MPMNTLDIHLPSPLFKKLSGAEWEKIYIDVHTNPFIKIDASFVEYRGASVIRSLLFKV